MRPRRYIPYSERHAPDYVPEPLPFADEPPEYAADEPPALIRATVAGLAVLFVVAVGMGIWSGR